jgi:hypothetical protein
MAEKIADIDHVDYNSNDEKSGTEGQEQPGRRESVALNIVENPLRVSRSSLSHGDN